MTGINMKMISKLKSLQKIDIPLICVITDYAPHLTWINPGVNAYVVANSDMIDDIAKAVFPMTGGYKQLSQQDIKDILNQSL